MKSCAIQQYQDNTEQQHNITIAQGKGRKEMSKGRKRRSKGRKEMSKERKERSKGSGKGSKEKSGHPILLPLPSLSSLWLKLCGRKGDQWMEQGKVQFSTNSQWHILSGDFLPCFYSKPQHLSNVQFGFIRTQALFYNS